MGEIKEYILCSAIWFNDDKKHIHQPKNIDKGYVISGRRHHNCFASIVAIKGENWKRNTTKEIQGFITNTYRFVDRQEASIIALNAGQIKEIKKTLFSEDLY